MVTLSWNAGQLAAFAFIPACCLLGFAFAAFHFYYVLYQIPVPRAPSSTATSHHVELHSVSNKHQSVSDVESARKSASASESAKSESESSNQVYVIYSAIREGADSFMHSMLWCLSWYVCGFAVFVLLVIGISTKQWRVAGLTSVAFVAGASTSALSGWLGMCLLHALVHTMYNLCVLPMCCTIFRECIG